MREFPLVSLEQGQRSIYTPLHRNQAARDEFLMLAEKTTYVAESVCQFAANAKRVIILFIYGGPTGIQGWYVSPTPLVRRERGRMREREDILYRGRKS